MVIMFFWGGYVYIRSKRPPANAMQINVVGKQWMWKIQHPEGPREINALHVPMGRPIKLRDDLAGRDSRFRHPRVPHQAGRDPRHRTHRMVRSRPAPANTTCSATNTAAICTRE